MLMMSMLKVDVEVFVLVLSFVFSHKTKVELKTRESYVYVSRYETRKLHQWSTASMGSNMFDSIT